MPHRGSRGHRAAAALDRTSGQDGFACCALRSVASHAARMAAEAREIRRGCPICAPASGNPLIQRAQDGGATSSTSGNGTGMERDSKSRVSSANDSACRHTLSMIAPRSGALCELLKRCQPVAQALPKSFARIGQSFADLPQCTLVLFGQGWWSGNLNDCIEVARRLVWRCDSLSCNAKSLSA